jgi:small redox-active disulfide protein 2
MLKIEVLGPGCVKCDNTFEKVKQAVEELKLEVELIKVTDVFQIIDRGVNFTPALVINGKLVFQGEEPSQEQIREILNRQISRKEEIS